MPRDMPSERRSWLLQKRCVLRRPQLTLLFATLCAPTLGVGVGFLFLGYWHILGYALLEMAALALCLHMYAKHLDDYDRIDISEIGIVIEQRRGADCSRRQLDLWTTRLMPSERESDPIRLSDHRDRMVVLGRFLSTQERRYISAELGQWLRRHGD